MSDSSDEEALTRVSSEPKVYEYDVVPEDKKFKMQLIDGDKEDRFLFVLKKGKSLPYTAVINKLDFKFARDLSISIESAGWRAVPSEKYFCFSRQKEDSQELTLDVVANIGDGVVIPTLPAAETAEDINPPEPVTIDDTAMTALKKLLAFNKDEKNYVCLICFSVGDTDDMVLHHILTTHDNWREVEIQPVTEKSPRSVFNNPNWKHQLISNFKSNIIDKCSQLTREAWENNEEVRDLKLFKRIRKEIIQTMEDKILMECGNISPPSEQDIVEIITKCLVPGYEFMFGDTPSSASRDKVLGYGYGRGGERGNKDLHKHIWRNVFKAQQKARRHEYEASDQFKDDQAAASVTKKGRKPKKYGVDNNLWWQECSEEQLESLKTSSEKQTVEEREEYYQEHRAALMNQIRTSTRLIDRVVFRFFDDPIHIKKMFKYLTQVEDLREKIQLNWNEELSKMRQYIVANDKKGDVKELLSQIEERIETEHHGSKTLLDVYTLRGLCELLEDKQLGDGKFLILMQDEVCDNTGPFLKARELNDKSFKFELWADKVQLLQGQDLLSAVSSYIELCFVFQLEYPKPCQTVSNLVQLKICGYGDPEKGTLTKMRKDSALRKKQKYERHFM